MFFEQICTKFFSYKPQGLKNSAEFWDRCKTFTFNKSNDKLTAIFTNSFDKNYKQGNSSAEATQKSALELIRNKSDNMHEFYYWADFTLNGDFR